MGPAACKVFTVVSTNVPHASIMARLVPEFHNVLGNLRVLLTWRATEVARLEQRTLFRKLPVALGMLDEGAVYCDFKPIVEILLQGEEVNAPPYGFGVVPMAPRPRQ
ncbi:Hypothetical protein, putative [Bodo saltans]|uniref:Uncharacterized protein n=1 Tax=Bodo saltans TaxID=75058 RepID=A0A0S4JM24_BODSA|nr:Hypothetical protein, putative [Bodo saltans]|eukprot:CUG90964.1 Hypothetical protein, putative [Bodo saltans]